MLTQPTNRPPCSLYSSALSFCRMPLEVAAVTPWMRLVLLIRASTFFASFFENFTARKSLLREWSILVKGSTIWWRPRYNGLDLSNHMVLPYYLYSLGFAGYLRFYSLRSQQANLKKYATDAKSTHRSFANPSESLSTDWSCSDISKASDWCLWWD